MELQLRLQTIHGNAIPINYQYELSSWIYKVIERADAQYSDFLHNKGFEKTAGVSRCSPSRNWMQDLTE
jgi:CRISPR-associated endoribonuclease Cas6